MVRWFIGRPLWAGRADTRLLRNFIDDVVNSVAWLTPKFQRRQATSTCLHRSLLSALPSSSLPPVSSTVTLMRFFAGPPQPAVPSPAPPSLVDFFTTSELVITCALIIVVPILFQLMRRMLRKAAAYQGEGRVILITGCDSGFGQSLARAARDADFDVVAACYTEAGAHNFDGVERISTIVADLTTVEGRARVVTFGTAVAGARGLHALVNNAGLCLPGNVEWVPPGAYERSMALNFHAPVALTYELLPALKAAKGRVINVTSVDGFLALPTNASYNASKHALEAYSDALRCEMRPWGVQVVVIEPATMRTPVCVARVFERSRLDSRWRYPSRLYGRVSP